MPFGLVFRKAVLWHEGRQRVFRNLQEVCDDRGNMRWKFHCAGRDGFRLAAEIDGSGPSVHRLPYLKTNCSGSFEVANNSLATAALRVEDGKGSVEELETSTGAVLEIVG